MQKLDSGFSLIELLVTLAFMGILISYGIPNLNKLLIRQSISTLANDMLVDISFARSEAITGGVPVTIIANDTWNKGWEIVTDQNYDGINETIRISNAEDKGIIITDSNEDQFITFNPTGTYKSNVSREIIFKHGTIDQYKKLSISLSGNTNIN